MRMHPMGSLFARHSTPLGVVSVSLLMALAVLVFYGQSESVYRARNMVTHTYEVSSHIQALITRLQDAETAQRGYLLTGSDEYLASYRQKVGDAGEAPGSPHSLMTEISILRKLTADNPVQQNNLDELGVLLRARVDRLDHVIVLRQKEGLEAVVREVSALHGKQMMDRISRIAGNMMAEENRLLATRTQADNAGVHRNLILTLCGVAMFYIGLMSSLALLTRHARLSRSLEAEARANAQSLLDSRMFLKNILNHVADPIFVKDRQHRWVDGNSAFWALMGRSEGEVCGRSDYDFFPKEQADIFWQKDEEVFSSGKPNINIENLTDPSGTMHILSTKKACFRTPDGELILVGIIRDITGLTQMQEKLKQSDEARLKSIMDQSGRPVYIKDLEGRFIVVNEVLLKHLEREEKDVLGKTSHDLFPACDADQFRAHDKEVIAKGAAIEFEETAMHPSGKHTYSSVKFPLFDANGRIYAVCGISTDITQRKQEDLAKSWLAAIVESSDDVIISKTADDIITSWNPAAERLFGYSAPEAVGQPITLIIPPERRNEENDIWIRLREGLGTEHFETVRIAKDGRRIDISLTVSPVYDAAGNIVGASKILRDITSRKEIEDRLQRYMHALERSNQELDDFAYIASHDMKEPLRGLFNHATFLIEDYKDKLGEDGARRLRRLAQLSQRMERLVNDLLYFSRLGRSDLAVQESDPAQIMADIQQRLESMLKERHARVVIKPMPCVVCDKPRITEVFYNLVTNAIKYNDKPEPVVEVGYLEEVPSPQGARQGVFYVKDNGVGIEQEFYQEIFRIFKRLQPVGREGETGTGAGLTFVKKIVERHNGQVWLESEPGNGSIFYFTLGTLKTEKTEHTDRRAA